MATSAISNRCHVEESADQLRVVLLAERTITELILWSLALVVALAWTLGNINEPEGMIRLVFILSGLLGIVSLSWMIAAILTGKSFLIVQQDSFRVGCGLLGFGWLRRYTFAPQTEVKLYRAPAEFRPSIDVNPAHAFTATWSIGFQQGEKVTVCLRGISKEDAIQVIALIKDKFPTPITNAAFPNSRETGPS